MEGEGWGEGGGDGEGGEGEETGEEGGGGDEVPKRGEEEALQCPLGVQEEEREAVALILLVLSPLFLP